MAVGYNPRVVTDGLVLALDAGNTKSFVDLSPQGQQAFTTHGSYTWTCPSGVYSVGVVCVGAGGQGQSYGGQGGSLAYKNNITVTPGQSYAIEVGETNMEADPNSPTTLLNRYAGLSSAFGTYAYGGRGGNTNLGSHQGIGGNYDGGGIGGNGSTDAIINGGYKFGSGGGAGGYSGSGGNGSNSTSDGGAGSGGGGGGGAPGSSTAAGGGGGVGIYGEGNSGIGGTFSSSPGGKGGSSGADGAVKTNSITGGGLYGGGGSGYGSITNNGSGGAVRIIWGSGRSFPSTNTADVTPQSGSTNWSDISGKGNNGTLTNGPTFSSDNGGAIVFDGTNDYVVTSTSINPSGTDLFTYSAWIYIDTISGSFGGSIKGAVLFSGDAHGRAELVLKTDTNTAGPPDRITFNRYGGSTTGSCNVEVDMSVGVWYNITLVRDGASSQKVYQNGVEIGTGNVSNSFTADTMKIGGAPSQSSYSGHFDGKMSNILYYNKALTAAEVQQNYNALKGRY